MKLSDRIRLIISENGLKQKEFAQSIQVTESYISKLLRDESGVSHSTATLIEERYGYSAGWILDGKEPKMSRKGRNASLSPVQRRVIADIEQMDDKDLAAVKAFIDTFNSYKKALGQEEIMGLRLFRMEGFHEYQ